MRQAMGGDQDAITAESVNAVQRCTGEFLSFVVSEARVRAARENRGSVGYADIVGALSVVGFRPFLEPLKTHMLQHYGEGAKRPAKRPRPEEEPSASTAQDTGGPAMPPAAADPAPPAAPTAPAATSGPAADAPPSDPPSGRVTEAAGTETVETINGVMNELFGGAP